MSRRPPPLMTRIDSPGAGVRWTVNIAAWCWVLTHSATDGLIASMVDLAWALAPLWAIALGVRSLLLMRLGRPSVAGLAMLAARDRSHLTRTPAAR